MKTWRFAITARRCGRCGATIPAGVRHLVLSSKDWTRDLIRCEPCAAPHERPLAPPPAPEPTDG